MSIFDSIFDFASDKLSSSAIIDLYWIVSDLTDIPMTESEWAQQNSHDQQAMLGSAGIEVRNGHVYRGGEDMGRVGKCNL